MKWFLIVVIGLFFALQLYIRFAPAKISDWHVLDKHQRVIASVDANTSHSIIREEGGAFALFIADDPQIFERLIKIALATPRTRIFAGSAKEGMVTFETRSVFWGFPDYTTVKLAGQEGDKIILSIHARLRFGRKDFGVNKRRLENWFG